MASWPSTWKTSTLQNAGIPVTADSLAIMTAWCKSTPLEPYTNNPIGMPSNSPSSARVSSSAYAMFRDMSTFYAEFARFIKTQAGQNVARAMVSDAAFAEAWRAISALGWPGSKTETDYPSALLDITEAKFRASVSTSPKDHRKTSGTVGASAATHNAIRQQTRTMYNLAASMNNAAEASRTFLRKHAQDG